MPGLTGNPGFFWIPVEDPVYIGTSAGMTETVVIKDAAYNRTVLK
jgi:hypothetical protein